MAQTWFLKNCDTLQNQATPRTPWKYLDPKMLLAASLFNFRKSHQKSAHWICSFGSGTWSKKVQSINQYMVYCLLISNAQSCLKAQAVMRLY
jgi:hypothetical protein